MLTRGERLSFKLKNFLDYRRKGRKKQKIVLFFVKNLHVFNMRWDCTSSSIHKLLRKSLDKQTKRQKKLQWKNSSSKITIVNPFKL